MRRRHEAANPGKPADQDHRGREVQDVRLRLGDRIVIAGDRVGKRQDGGRGSADQEHRHSERAVTASGQDSLLGSCPRRDSGCNT